MGFCYADPMKLNRQKLKALVHYIIWRAGSARDFGAVMLNKMLWFSDARAFEAFGKPITGETYIRRKLGPVPKHVDSVLDELVDQEAIEVWTERFHEHRIKRYAAFAPPDMSDFNADELGFIDWWIKHVSEEHTAVSISEKSHDYGWQIANEGEELPYTAFLARRVRDLHEGDELEWARSIASEIKGKVDA